MLPLQLRVAAVQEIDTFGIEAEVVVVFSVAQVTQAVACCVLGVFFGDFAAGGQLVVVLYDAEGYLDDILSFLLAVLKHAVLELEQRNQTENDQPDQCQSDQELHACGYP